MYLYNKAGGIGFKSRTLKLTSVKEKKNFLYLRKCNNDSERLFMNRENVKTATKNGFVLHIISNRYRSELF